MRRTSTNSLVVPITIVSRKRPPALASDNPTAIGASRRIALARCKARASSIVKSRGVLVTTLAGLKPPVCERPGNTITRLLPIEEN